jgi:hypothetical protein
MSNTQYDSQGANLDSMPYHGGPMFNQAQGVRVMRIFWFAFVAFVYLRWAFFGGDGTDTTVYIATATFMLVLDGMRRGR